MFIRLNTVAASLAACLVALAPPSAFAQTKLLRYPDIAGDRVAFCYAGDIWTSPAKGGNATRLTAHAGLELFTRFSPDGKWLAFTGQYEGDEHVDDLVKTMEMMDDVKDYRSLIVPLFFVPMGRLKDEDWFKENMMTKIHDELLIKCIEHDFRWLNSLIDMSFAESWKALAIKPFYKLFTSTAKFKIRRKGINAKL